MPSEVQYTMGKTKKPIETNINANRKWTQRKEKVRSQITRHVLSSTHIRDECKDLQSLHGQKAARGGVNSYSRSYTSQMAYENLNESTARRAKTTAYQRNGEDTSEMRNTPEPARNTE